MNAKEFYEANATNVVNVPRVGHLEDKSGWDGVRRACEAKFVAGDALVMTLKDAIDFAEKFHASLSPSPGCTAPPCECICHGVASQPETSQPAPTVGNSIRLIEKMEKCTSMVAKLILLKNFVINAIAVERGVVTSPTRAAVTPVETEDARNKLMEIAARIARREYLPSLERCVSLNAAAREVAKMDDRHGKLAMELKAEIDKLRATDASASSTKPDELKKDGQV